MARPHPNWIDTGRTIKAYFPDGMKRLFLFLVIAAAALADTTQTITFSDGAYISLDTGQATQSPAPGDVYDIQWTGGTIVRVGTAKIANVGIRTSAQFTLVTESDIKNHLILGGVASIPAANIIANDIFETITNFGNASKIFVVSKTSTQLTVMFYTYQSAPPGAPTITGVLNNSSRILDGLPNSGIAPSSLFIVQGTKLGDTITPSLHSTLDPGLPLSLNGVSLTVTVGGVVTHPALYYTCNQPKATPCDSTFPDVASQVAAVMPANTPVGSGTITATYNGLTSAPFSIQVVASAPGLNVYGANIGVATDSLSGALLTLTSSGSPGQAITLWTTGLGADPADSDTTYTLTPHAINVNLQVFIGGLPAQITYRGSGGYPGVDVVNLIIPPGVSTGCWVGLAASINGVLSNVATLPINAGGGDCFDEINGIRGSQISPGHSVTFRSGFVALGLSNTPDQNNGRTIAYASTADFSKYTATTYDLLNQVSPGGCIIRQTKGSVLSITGLDAGTITLKGPNGLDVTLQHTLGIVGAYNATLPTIPSTGGTYTWTGTGGSGVGSFSSTLNLSNPLMIWTNPEAAASVDPSAGLTVKWTGGNPGSYVYISGGAEVHKVGSTVVPVNYTCVEHIEAGQFTVPAYILSALPPAGIVFATQVADIIEFPLSAEGIDYSSGLGSIAYTANTAFK